MHTDFVKHLNSISKISAEFNAKLSNIKTEFKNSCAIGQNGGLFTVTPTLLFYLNLHKDDDCIIVLDDLCRPIMVDAQFLKDCSELYDMSLRVYHHKFKKLIDEKNTKLGPLYESAI